MVLEEFNKPLVRKEVEDQGEVEVDVKSSGVCGRDIVIWKGGFRNLRPPLVLGHEVYGELEGRAVGIFSTVVCNSCRYCKSGEENLCENSVYLGEGRYGGYAEKVIIPRGNVYPLPDSNYEKYAAAVCPLATAIHSSKLAGVRPGDKVLVTGAGGGVGIHTIQYLKLLGAHVVSITSKEKEGKVKPFSDEVISEGEFHKEVDDVDVVIEIVGAPTINESLRTLKRGGTLVLVGNVSGENVEVKRPALLIMRQITVKGSAAYTRNEVLESVKMINNGKIRPIYEKFKLEDVNEAIQKMVAGTIAGRAVLVN
ncbi:alcohol dehydrogenase [Sulfolobales archaeon HS-7]|nr:alcohol dehydrogenase [Sulfolobales archaeon HS-7]